jgi:hypothetical protein
LFVCFSGVSMKSFLGLCACGAKSDDDGSMHAVLLERWVDSGLMTMPE